MNFVPFVVQSLLCLLSTKFSTRLRSEASAVALRAMADETTRQAKSPPLSPFEYEDEHDPHQPLAIDHQPSLPPPRENPLDPDRVSGTM